MSGLRQGGYGVENRLPYERRRVEEIRKMLAEGINPLRTTIINSSGSMTLTVRDMANYFEVYKVPFRAVVRSRELGDDNGSTGS